MSSNEWRLYELTRAVSNDPPQRSTPKNRPASSRYRCGLYTGHIFFAHCMREYEDQSVCSLRSVAAYRPRQRSTERSLAGKRRASQDRSKESAWRRLKVYFSTWLGSASSSKHFGRQTYHLNLKMDYCSNRCSETAVPTTGYDGWHFQLKAAHDQVPRGRTHFYPLCVRMEGKKLEISLRHGKQAAPSGGT